MSTSNGNTVRVFNHPFGGFPRGLRIFFIIATLIIVLGGIILAANLAVSWPVAFAWMGLLLSLAGTAFASIVKTLQRKAIEKAEQEEQNTKEPKALIIVWSASDIIAIFISLVGLIFSAATVILLLCQP